MSSIVLFDDKKDCCGCGACMNVCPKNAIRMAEDEVGFVYPEIDQNLCVGCGACKKACGYQTQPLMQKSEAVYAAASNNDNFLRKSASGGAFAVLAENVLKKDGVVYGAALPLENGKLEPKHLRIDTVERLPELQGYSQPQILFNFPKPPSPRTCLIRKACIIQVQRKKRLVLEQSGSGDTER